MTTFLPGDLPPDRQLAPPPLPAFVPMLRVDTPAPYVEQRRRMRPVALAGLLGLVVAAAMGIPQLVASFGNYSPAYSGAPVEAADANDGVTIVGYDNAIAYQIQPGWVDLVGYLDGAGELAFANDPDLVGSHLTGNPMTSIPDGMALYAFDESFPRRSLSELHAEGLDYVVQKTSGTLVEASGPITTANGLSGFTGAATSPTESGTATYTFIVLGNGSTVALLIWISFTPEPDEAAFRTWLNSVRIDG
jgi:hypothetical protein